jgi:hypothetical protein
VRVAPAPTRLGIVGVNNINGRKNTTAVLPKIQLKYKGNKKQPQS